MPLPKSCADCTFYETRTSRCRRHATGTGYGEMEITHWPIVPKSFRCGSGVPVGDGAESPVPCKSCLHWYQPGGKGLSPEYLQDLSAAWWRESGYCTRYAPSPSAEEGRRAWHRVTNGAMDRCGDGEAVEDLAPMIEHLSRP